MATEDLHNCGPFAEASPAEVRAAVPPEDAAAFDAEWREMNEMLDGWRRTAWSFTHDPAAHRHMIDVAARLNRGEDIPTVKWPEHKAAMGL